MPAGVKRLAQVATIFDRTLMSHPVERQSDALPALLDDLLSDIGLVSGAGDLGLSSSEVGDLVDVAYANYWRGIERWIKPGGRADMLELAKASL